MAVRNASHGWINNDIKQISCDETTQQISPFEKEVRLKHQTKIPSKKPKKNPGFPRAF